MVNFIISSDGFQANGFFFPGFSLKEQEYLSIDMPGNLDFDFNRALCGILSGGTKIPQISLSRTVVPVLIPETNLLSTIFLAKTAYRFLKDESILPDETIYSVLDKMGVNPKFAFHKLGMNEKKILALEAAYSKSRNIILCAAGLDYMGYQSVRNRIFKEMELGSTIEINYPNSRGRDYLFKEPEVICKRIVVEPA